MASRISTVSLSIEKETKDHGVKEGTMDFEKAMEICGNGRYQYTFLLVCGIMFICVGCQYGANAYILPSAECDLNMRSEEKGLLNVAFLIGSVFSALFWGIFAGAYGRRNILLLNLFTDSIVTLIASFAPNFKLLLVFRVISGFLMGGPGSLVYTYLGEFHAERYRAKSICFLGFFFTLAWLILPGLAWIIIPLPISFDFYGIRYNSWRLFLGSLSLPIFAIAAITLTYPESPKFLVSQGKTDEALAILRTIYAVNTGRDESEFPVKELLSEAVFEIEKDKAPSSSDVLTELLKNIWWQLRTIASPPLFKYALLLWTIYFTNMFGYYAFNLWQPELFNRFENYHQSHPNASVTVCELIHDMQTLNRTVMEKPFLVLTNGVTTECKPHIDQRVFINSLTINAVCLLGNVASGYLANRVDRRTMPVTTMLVAGVASLGMYFVKSSLQILITACIFSLMAATANFVISSVAVDVFPTHVSAAAVCMMVCLGRFGAMTSNLAFGMLLDLSCEIPIFLVTGITIIGSMLCFLIPSKEKK
ncbi:synaptic vesicle glycoprotein 2C [Temnothorax longispinosus]|uniref:synaptic vesicle glycoprotein 2C n=1 Tax=Temnothorax longispinosus TaxID=300112 RepID=UPI003A9A2FB1